MICYDPNKPPHIAISVDMLDTGIDVPELVNLVFFKPVRSKTKFWQMIGRGTRLCPNLFGPGRHKEFFYIFDWCRNFEFFSQNPPATAGSAGQSLSRRLFAARLHLIQELDRKRGAAPPPERRIAQQGRPAYGDDTTEDTVRTEVASLLHDQVAAMNLDNFIVRVRQHVEKYAKPEVWETLGDDEVRELTAEVAGLPTELVDDDEEAKRFDLLMLKLELTVLRVQPAFVRLRD